MRSARDVFSSRADAADTSVCDLIFLREQDALCDLEGPRAFGFSILGSRYSYSCSCSCSKTKSSTPLVSEQKQELESIDVLPLAAGATSFLG